VRISPVLSFAMGEMKRFVAPVVVLAVTITVFLMSLARL